MKVSLVCQRLRELRISIGISQEAIGAQGFVSAPGWAKIENGTRQPSDELLEKLANWMVKDGYLKSRQKSRLLEELLSLKYMEHLSPFVRRLT
jgi:transcriptional regulator with XRE-family HTH domain